MTRRVQRASVLLLTWAAACGPAQGGRPAVQADYGEPFVLGTGEMAEVGGEYRVRFERVAGDTRCPEGARCVQAGSASAVFGIESGHGTATLTLHVGREPRSAAAMGGELRLEAIDPTPRPGDVPEQADYRAALVVRRTP